MINFNFRFFRKKISEFPKPNEYELLEKESILETKSPIYLDSDLDKVRCIPFGRTIRQEIQDFKSNIYKSGPFYQYHINDFLLLKNRIYFDKYEYGLVPSEKVVRFYDSDDVDEYDNTAFTSMRISTAFFGHWLHEELMLIDYLQLRSNILSSSKLTPQKKEIIDFFDLNLHVSSYAFIKNARMFEGWQHSEFYKNTLIKYKEKISLLANNKKNHRQSIVYLKRGNLGTKRILENEDKFIESLSKEFEVLSFIAESTPVLELYSAIYNADIILGIEGSQMAHAIISGKVGSTLVCIQPPNRFYNPFKNYCADAGLRYSVFVADQGDNENFYVNTERFKKLLEKIYIEN